MRYRLKNLHSSDIVQRNIPSESRLYMRFGSTMMKYAFTSPPTKAGVEVKAIHRVIMR